MSRLALLLVLVSTVGCANTEYRFERIDGPQPSVLPFKFDGIRGVRDGASVNAEARFSDGADVITMNITLHLVPPPEFRSGVYEATMGGQTTAGGVESRLMNETLGMIAPYIFHGGAGVGVAVVREHLEKAKPIVEDYAANKSRRLHEV